MLAVGVLAVTLLLLTGCHMAATSNTSPGDGAPPVASRHPMPILRSIAQDILLTGSRTGHIGAGRSELCGAAAGVEQVALGDLPLGTGGGFLRIVVRPFMGPGTYQVGIPVKPAPRSQPVAITFRPDGAAETYTAVEGWVRVDPDSISGTLLAGLASTMSDHALRLSGAWRCANPTPSPASPSPGLVPYRPDPAGQP